MMSDEMREQAKLALADLANGDPEAARCWIEDRIREADEEERLMGLALDDGMARRDPKSQTADDLWPVRVDGGILT